ncbi:hypothetical protein DEO72_LG2g4526 [Vigna unguiculata]|uniref:Uncharacterized protein n=1 Tax=Vigna unguiculata TaxID=3917 RepID=A0A4D6L6S6_VIGUN|nr:hypothetical protein DEO72_LG2g4526 [Vigna unguiculata]
MEVQHQRRQHHDGGRRIVVAVTEEGGGSDGGRERDERWSEVVGDSGGSIGEREERVAETRGRRRGFANLKP